jgi:hypothetical protein
MGLFTMPGRARDTEQWGKKGEHPTPRATQMFIKIKELRQPQLVRT